MAKPDLIFSYQPNKITTKKKKKQQQQDHSANPDLQSNKTQSPNPEKPKKMKLSGWRGDDASKSEKPLFMVS